MQAIPGVQFQYPKPLNFDPDDALFDIFKNLKPENCFAPEVRLEKNIRISNNSVAFRYFKIFRESCIAQEIFEQYQSSHRFFVKYILPQFNFSKKRFLLISDEWSSNYYHWHVFALSKLVVLQNQNLDEGALIALPEKYKNYPLAIKSLEKFGIAKDRIIFIRRKSNIKVAELPLVRTNQHHPIIFKKIREVLLRNIEKNAENFAKKFGDKIYISRENSTARFVENEKEFMAILEKYGFQKVLAEQLTYDEQIAIFSKTKYLVSPHGAGLTNILFMPENGFILELATGYHPQKPLTDFYKMATMLNVNYLYQRCKMGESTKSKTSDPHEGSVDVDLAIFEKNLQLMLKK